MDEIQIVAILDRSAGNESVGEMWKETKVFPISAPLSDVLKWANKTQQNGRCPENLNLECFKGNLVLTIAQ